MTESFHRKKSALQGLGINLFTQHGQSQCGQEGSEGAAERTKHGGNDGYQNEECDVTLFGVACPNLTARHESKSRPSISSYLIYPIKLVSEIVR